MQDSINLYDLRSILLLMDEHDLYLHSIDDYDKARSCIIRVYNDETKDIFDRLNEYIRNKFTDMPKLPSGVGQFQLNYHPRLEWYNTEWAVMTAEEALASWEEALKLKPKEFREAHKHVRH